jgi:hypothetical protein
MQLTVFAQPLLSAQRALSAFVLQPSRTRRTAPCTAPRPLTVSSPSPASIVTVLTPSLTKITQRPGMVSFAMNASRGSRGLMSRTMESLNASSKNEKVFP